MEKQQDAIFEGIKNEKIETPNTKLKKKFTNIKMEESEKMKKSEDL